MYLQRHICITIVILFNVLKFVHMTTEEYDTIIFY